ncbi:MAG: hypothetical protein ACP5E5_02520 [Acidobacteriaceae bacterium]
MNSRIHLAGILLLANLFPSAKAANPATQPSVQDQIAQAVMALPPELRADATVVTYNPQTGARTVLRQGTNSLECEPAHPPDGFINCYSDLVAPRRELEAKLRAQKKTDKEIDQEMAAETKAGKLKEPPFGIMYYRLATKPGVIKWLWVFSVPNATTQSTGISTKSQRDAALQGHGLPWLMLAGTPHAHIMIPINQ